VILALDPSLAMFGMVALLGDGRWKFSTASTEPESKKRHWYHVDDNQRRIRFILDTLDRFVGQCGEPVSRITAEVPCFSRSIVTLEALNRLNGALIGWARNHTTEPIFFVRPEEVKAALTGREDAEKPDMVRAAEELGLPLPPVRIVARTGKPAKSQEERWGVADSYGVLIASGLWKPQTAGAVA